MTRRGSHGAQATTRRTWSASHELPARAAPADVWGLWEDHTRWHEWNREVRTARPHGPFQAGAEYTLRFRGSVPMRFTIVALEHEREFTDEGRLPGALMGHQRVIAPAAGGGVRIRNRVYFEGRLARVYGALMGRRMRRGVRDFVEREAALAEHDAAAAGSTADRAAARPGAPADDPRAPGGQAPKALSRPGPAQREDDR